MISRRQLGMLAIGGAGAAVGGTGFLAAGASSDDGMPLTRPGIVTTDFYFMGESGFYRMDDKGKVSKIS